MMKSVTNESSQKIYRVLGDVERTREEPGGVTVYEREWIEVSRDQAMRYAAGDPDWRTGVAPASSLLERFRGWVRSRLALPR